LDHQNPQWYVGRRYAYTRVKPDHISAPFVRYFDKRKLPAPGLKAKFYPPSYRRIELPTDLGEQLQQARLLTCLHDRRTRRSISADPLAVSEVAKLLIPSLGKSGVFHAADIDGKEVEGAAFDGASYPSPGGLFACTTYVIWRETPGGPHAGFYVDQLKNTLVQVTPHFDVAGSLLTGADWARAAPLIVVICSWYGRIAEKYGAHAYRKSFIEAGHIGQNLTLCATALGLKNVPLSGFDYQRLAAQLDLKETEETPIYTVVIGK
jgi:SagB-type dehydrogenase family enzyme